MSTRLLSNRAGHSQKYHPAGIGRMVKDIRSHAPPAANAAGIGVLDNYFCCCCKPGRTRLLMSVSNTPKTDS